MKQVCLSNNIVFVYNRNVYDDFNTDEIEEKIKIVYSSQDPAVGSTNFPNELKAVFSTNLQLQVVAQQKNVVVAYTKINEGNEIADTDIVRLALSVQRVMKDKSLTNRFYGFNFIFSFLEIDFSEIEQKIRSKYFRSESVSSDTPLQFALPSMSYVNDGAQYTFKYDVEIDEDAKPSKVNVACNVHFSDPTATENDEQFLDLYKSSYAHAYEIVGDLE